jgi:uncharacterized membrane protein YadS
MLRKEDWWAVWLGFLILAAAATRLIPSLPTISKWTANPATAISIGDLPYFFLLCFLLLTLTSIAVLAMKEKMKSHWTGFPIVFLLAFLALLLSYQKTLNEWGFEYVLWALVFGLLISNTVGIPKWLKSALKTELFIKTGLVLLGAELLFQTVIRAGTLAMVQAVIGVFAVWFFCYFLAVKVGLSKSFASVLSSAVSICGVSAAIATAGSIRSDSKELSYTISMVLLISMPMLVGLPIIAKALGMSGAVAGAWIGGTIDTTAAVVAAGALYSEQAMQVASLVKLSQNALIGLVAFALAFYWLLKMEKKPGARPRPLEIWYRFPKFVLGFILASIIFSFLLAPTMDYASMNAVLNVSKGIRGWFFALAFVGIGLDTRFRDLAKLGNGKPIAVFITAQIFNILLVLLLAYIIFGGMLFPSPLA